MLKIILTQLSLLIVISQAQTYLFSEGNGILTICPRIMRSLSVPSFRLEPTSTSREFLNGSYNIIYPAEDLPAGIQLNPENGPCDNSDDKMCSKLSLLYQNNQPLGRGSITVRYTASNEAVRMIRINYGFVGIYLEESSEVVVRVLGRPTTLNDSVLAFGNIPQPLLLCYENGTQEPLADILVVSIPEDTCSSNIAPNGLNAQPGRFKMTIPLDVTGQHRVYIAARNCTSLTTSSIFDVIFDAPTTTEGPGPSTTPRPTTTPPTSTGLPLGAVIGGIIGGLVLVGVIVVIVIVVSCYVWYKSRRIMEVNVIENGLLRGVEGRDHESPDLRTTADVTKTDIPSPPLQKKKLYVVLSIDHENLVLLQQKLYDSFSNLERATLPNNENGSFERYLKQIMDEHHIVIILGYIGEIKIQPKNMSSGRKLISTFISSPAYSGGMLQNVYLVLFGTNESVPAYLNDLQQIPVPEHYDNDDFDPAEASKLVSESIQHDMALISQNQLNQLNQRQTCYHLNRQPNGNSPHSTPHLPLQTRLSTSDLGSEISETSLKGAANENIDAVDTAEMPSDRVQGSPRPPTDPRLTDIKDHSHKLPVPGGLNSDSAASLKKLTEMMTKVESDLTKVTAAVREEGESNRAAVTAAVREEGELNRVAVTAAVREEGELGRAATREEGELGRAATREEGELGRAATREEGELGRAAMREEGKKTQEDIQYLGEAMEESWKEKQNQEGQDSVIKPGDNTT